MILAFSLGLSSLCHVIAQQDIPLRKTIGNKFGDIEGLQLQNSASVMVDEK